MKIRYPEDASKLPYRSAYVDKPIHARCIEDMNAKNPLFFIPMAIHEADVWKPGQYNQTPGFFYTIYLSGIIPGGAKTCAIIEGIYPFFDVLIPNTQSADSNPVTTSFVRHPCDIDLPDGVDNTNLIDTFKNVVKQTLVNKTNKDSIVRTMSVVTGFRYQQFSQYPFRWLRLYFNTKKDRTTALRVMRSQDDRASFYTSFFLASDDNSSYFNKWARESRINTSSWNRVTKYAVVDNPDRKAYNDYVDNSYASNYALKSRSYQYTKCDVTLLVNQSDIAAAADQDLREWSKGLPVDPFTKDRSVISVWDIETHSAIKDKVPTVGDEFTIFSIGISMGFHYSMTPFCTFVMSILDSEDVPDVDYVIICGSEKNLMRCFLDVYDRMLPDLSSTYNGGRFDIPLMVDKFKEYNMLYLLKDSLSILPPHYSCIETYNRPASSMSKRDRVAYKRSLGEAVEKYNYRELSIKIEAGNDAWIYLWQFVGLIEFDIMVVFKQLYPKSDHTNKFSLNDILALNKLGSKDDMSYNTMTRIYTTAKREAASADGPSAASLHDMGVVLHYNVVDCIKCHELLVKRTVLRDRREMANMPFVGLVDAFTKADGMKVRNMIASYASSAFGIMMSLGNQDHKPKLKYPGAYVFPPKTGLNRQTPIAGLDFASLYPSIIMTYNYSPERIVNDLEYVEQLTASGYSLVPSSFDAVYVDTGKTCNISGWFVRHNNIVDEAVDPPYVYDEKGEIEYLKRDGRLPNEKMGIFPYILKSLKDYRGNVLKPKLKALEDVLKKVEGGIQVTTKDKMPDAPVYAIDEYNDPLRRHEIIDNLRFHKGVVDSKQKAVKVFMNTFYGESGNHLSNIYSLLVAGSVTSTGQVKIKLCHQIVTSEGFFVIYGDTDSLYLGCEESAFEATNEALTNGEIGYEEWCTRRVMITQDEIGRIRDIVNTRLRHDTGTDYMSMMYEEVLFPSVFVGKKKYAGIPHVEDVNFDVGDMTRYFIRGLEFIKRGVAGLAKEVGYAVLKRALDIHNRDSLEDIVKGVVKDMLERKDYDIEYFRKSAKYKPATADKPGAVSVIRFVDRMNEMNKKHGDLFPEILSGDRFYYVIVKREDSYDYMGRIEHPSISDKMALVDIYLKSQVGDDGTPPLWPLEPMEIDMVYYVEGIVSSILGRYLSYMPQFNPNRVDDVDDVLGDGIMEDDVDLDALDKIIIKNAKAYVVAMTKQLGSGDDITVSSKGVYTSKFKMYVDRMVMDVMTARPLSDEKLLMGILTVLLKGAPEEGDMAIMTRIEVFIGKRLEALVKAHLKRMRIGVVKGMDMADLNRLYGRGLLEKHGIECGENTTFVMSLMDLEIAIKGRLNVALGGLTGAMDRIRMHIIKHRDSIGCVDDIDIDGEYVEGVCCVYDCAMELMMMKMAGGILGNL